MLFGMHIRSSLEIAGTVLAAGLLVGGCEDGAPTPATPHTTAPTGTTEATPGSPGAYEALPRGACSKLFVDAKHPAGAIRCIAAYSGEVAMVDYGTPLAEAETIAAETQAILVRASDGILTPTIEVVQATPAAKAALQKAVGPKGCIDTTDPADFASTVADETMSRTLHHYAKVLSLSSERPCLKQEGGAADEEGKLRDADVFPQLEAAQTLPLVAAHELLHLFGEGHDGSATNPDGTSYDLVPNTPSNIADHVQLMTDNEYVAPGPSPMGNGIDAAGEVVAPTNAQLSPIQLDALRWPFGILGEGDRPRAVAIDNAPVTLTCEQVQDGAVAAISLATPPAFGARNDPGNNGRHTFNELALTPSAYMASGKCELLGGYALTLVDTSTNTDVLLGSANVLPGDPAHWNFDIGDGNKTVTVSLTDQSFQVSAQ